MSEERFGGCASVPSWQSQGFLMLGAPVGLMFLRMFCTVTELEEEMQRRR